MGLHHEQITYLSAYFSCDSPECDELSEEINRDVELNGGDLAATAVAIGWQWDATTKSAYCPAHRANGSPAGGPRPCSPSAPRQPLSSMRDASAALSRDSGACGDVVGEIHPCAICL